MLTLWTFKTAQYEIRLIAHPEDTPPEDAFEFEDDIESVRNGDVEYFCAEVAVYKNGHKIGSDYLGACAYRTFKDFYTDHRDPDPMNRNCSIMRQKQGDNVVICHYFPGMVKQAIDDARKTLN